MLRHKPVFKYCGVTIIMSNPSRFDKQNLLSANGGGWFDNDCLRPELNKYMCDIRLKEDLSPLLDETRLIILLGESAAKLWCRDAELKIGQARGSIFYYDGRFTGQQCNIPMIPTFFPQDGVDYKDYETEFNKQDDTNVGGTDDEDEGNVKSRQGKTARRNYRFWIQSDIKKAKQIISTGIPQRLFEPIYFIKPPSKDLIHILTNIKGSRLFIDIETFLPSFDVQCVGFSFDNRPDIYIFPFFNSDYSLSYDDLPLLLRALAISFKNNTVIAHNGANFDFPIFAWKYRIPPSHNLEDTMIMQHRVFSDVEKSLGHFTSLWTYEPFHKDEASGWYNQQQCWDTMQYCGKDVFTMKLGYYNMLEYAQKMPGLKESWEDANGSILPYMTTMLQGFLYDDKVVKEIMNENDRCMMQYLRMIKILVGEHNLKAIQGKSKRPLPSSPTQCVKYFHELLGYPIVGKGQEHKDGSRAPSLGKKNLLKLRLKHDNPVIDIIQAYRECQKESGSLKFSPFDINNRNIPTEYNEQQYYLNQYTSNQPS